MATDAENAEVALTWKEATKLRKSLVKHIDRLIEGNTIANDKKTFEKVDDYLAKYRLSCMQVIFADFEYAHKNHVQRDLWETQLHVSKLYRSVIKNSRGQHVALRRIEKRYAAFLSLCQMFYEGYIQRLAAAHSIPELAKISKYLKQDDSKILSNSKSELSPEMLEMVTSACHDALIALGDLARYHLKLKGKNAIYESSVAFYGLANDLKPKIAHGHHGIGLANVEVNKHFLVVYHMYRAVVAEDPHPNALKNLATEFSHLRNPNASLATRDPSPLQVLEIIFVRLHSYFYSGNEIVKRAELERAFFRRLDEVLENEETKSAASLIQMAVVNICACDLASHKQADGSFKKLFHDYVFDFTCRFASYFAGTFTRRVNKIYASTPSTEGKLHLGVNTDADTPFTIDPVVEISLRILRIFSFWLISHKSDLISSSERLEKSITNFLCDVARSLTTISIFFGGHIEAYAHQHNNLPNNLYLLEEDYDLSQCPAMGKEAITTILEDPQATSGMLRKTFADQKQSSWIETLYRVTSILTSSQEFVRDDKFPITYAVVNGSQLVYAVDDQILPLAREYTSGDEVGADFPASLSAIKALSSPKQLKVPVAVMTVSSPTVVDPNSSKDYANEKPQTIVVPVVTNKPQRKMTDTAITAMLIAEPVTSIIPQLDGTQVANIEPSATTQPPPEFNNVLREQENEFPSLSNLTSSLLTVENPTVPDNLAPALDFSRKFQSMSWGSVYQPKPANNAWSQLTPDQYYNGPKQRTGFAASPILLNPAGGNIWGGNTFVSSPNLTMHPRVQQPPEFQDRSLAFGGTNQNFPYAEAEAYWNSIPQAPVSNSMGGACLTNLTPGFSMPSQAQSAYTADLSGQTQRIPSGGNAGFANGSTGFTNGYGYYTASSQSLVGRPTRSHDPNSLMYYSGD